MRKVVLTIALTLLSSSWASAQSPTQNETPQISFPASQEDLDAAKREWDRKLRATDKKSAARIEAAQKAAEESKKALAAQVAGKVDDKVNTATAQILAQQKAEAEKSRAMLVKTGVAVSGILVILGGIYVLAVRKGRRDVVPMSTTTETPKPMTNPRVDQVKDFAQEHNCSRVFFIRKLGNSGTSLDGKSIDCTALIQATGNPLVLVGDSDIAVAWDRHTNVASEVIAKREGIDLRKKVAS